MDIFITDADGVIKGAYFDEETANQVRSVLQSNLEFSGSSSDAHVTKLTISGDFKGECSDLLAQAIEALMTKSIRSRTSSNIGVFEARAIFSNMFHLMMQRFSESITKARKYDKIIEIMDRCYEEDSTADLCDIGEQVATFLKYT